MRHRLSPYPVVKFKGMMGNKKVRGCDNNAMCLSSTYHTGVDKTEESSYTVLR